MKKTLLLATLSLISSAYAYEAKITKGAMEPELDLLLEKATQETGVAFPKENITLIEERELATSKYRFYVQTSQFIPVEKTAVRIWTDKNTGELILAEMHLDEKARNEEASMAAKYKRAKFSPGAFKSQQLNMAINKIASQQASKHSTDNRILGLKSKDVWSNGDLVRVVEVRGRRGVHTVRVSLLRNKVISTSYTEFPQSEATHTLKANIFPMYEEVEGTGEKLPYEVKELKYISKYVAGGNDPLAEISKKVYAGNRYHALLAETEIGQQYDFWSQASMRRDAEAVVAAIPARANEMTSGLLLQGKYATINIHPDVKAQIPGVNFDLKAGPNHIMGIAQNGDCNRDGQINSEDTCGQEADGNVYGYIRPGFLGKPIASQEEVLNRIPVRLPDHDTKTYINSGVDELQVYYSVTVLMEALAEMGFKDKELSTRPFHAFLFDPDIGMRDNAYYTDDTINFTTYNPGSPNLARDNPTIWHELGHGVMDRLMGAHLGFAGNDGGYGGLSEGMADFVAKLVVEHQTNGADFPGRNDFRIENTTGFYLTNEFHDEGEAYGGVMKDMLATVLENQGRRGLVSFTDLTLEAMRLTRNHPALTAAGWFEHMLYADELGSSVRIPGEFKQIIVDALAARNFAFDSSFKAAQMNVKFGDTVLTSASPASREKPLEVCDASGVASYDLNVALTAGDSNFITFPATVKVEYKKGALQGAINWAGEENNPQVYTINSAEEALTVPVKASMKCETINQPDGSCKDYAYLQVFSKGGEKPIAKKRFYLKVKPSCQK